jgi:hypothetical protein
MLSNGEYLGWLETPPKLVFCCPYRWISGMVGKPQKRCDCGNCREMWPNGFNGYNCPQPAHHMGGGVGIHSCEYLHCTFILGK